MAAKKNENVCVRTIWGLAKSEELHLSSDNLHEIVSTQVGKDSIKDLNKREIATVVCYLSGLKDSVRKAEGQKTHALKRGNTGTSNQRKKIYKLVEDLGWDKPARINGMCKRMFKIACVEWLNYQQCSDLIEALKKMVARENEKVEE